MRMEDECEVACSEEGGPGAIDEWMEEMFVEIRTGTRSVRQCYYDACRWHSWKRMKQNGRHDHIGYAEDPVLGPSLVTTARRWMKMREAGRGPGMGRKRRRRGVVWGNLRDSSRRCSQRSRVLNMAEMGREDLVSRKH